MKAIVETRKAQVLTWSGKREFSDKKHRWVPVVVGSCENQVLKPSKNKGHCSQPTTSNTESLNKENDANWQNRARGLCWEHRYPWQEPGGLRGISQLRHPTCSAPWDWWIDSSLPHGRGQEGWGASLSPGASSWTRPAPLPRTGGWTLPSPIKEPGGLRGLSQPRCQLLDATCSVPLGKWRCPWGSSHSPDPSLILLSLWYLLHTLRDRLLLLFINAQLANAKVGACTHAKLLQSRVSLCDPVDRSPPGSPVRGILQARTVEWVAMPSCRGSSRPRDWTSDSCVSTWQALYYLCHLGSTTKVAGSFLKVGRTSTQQKFNLKKINSKMQNKKKKITNFLLESFRDHWGRAFLTQQGETELWSLKQTLRSHDNN